MWFLIIFFGLVSSTSPTSSPTCNTECYEENQSCCGGVCGSVLGGPLYCYTLDGPTFQPSSPTTTSPGVSNKPTKSPSNPTKLPTSKPTFPCQETCASPGTPCCGGVCSLTGNNLICTPTKAPIPHPTSSPTSPTTTFSPSESPTCTSECYANSQPCCGGICGSFMSGPLYCMDLGGPTFQPSNPTTKSPGITKRPSKSPSKPTKLPTQKPSEPCKETCISPWSVGTPCCEGYCAFDGQELFCNPDPCEASCLGKSNNEPCCEGRCQESVCVKTFKPSLMPISKQPTIPCLSTCWFLTFGAPCCDNGHCGFSLSKGFYCHK